MAHFVLPPIIVVIVWFLVNVCADQVPTPPAGVNVTRNGSHSIVVEWNDMPNVSEYHVYYQEKDDSAWNTELVPGNQTSLLIERLKPYTIYLVKIKANTTNGLSNFSVQVQARTDEAPPSALPKITEIRALDCCSIYLRWNPISAENENGVLLGYRLYYLKKADMSDYKNKHKKVFLNITLRRTNLTDLHPYTEYLVGVAAYNSKGVDENLATIVNVERVRTLEGAPSAPSGLTAKFISSSELVIQWVLIPKDKANGVLLGYRYVVYYNQTQVVNETVSNSTNSTHITGMKRCADYTVKLRAWTAAGAGMNAVFNITNICASPKIINHKPRVNIKPFEPAVLHCDHTGFPTPAVTWILSDRTTILPPGKQARDVLTGPPYERYIKNNPNGSLTFDYVVYSDKGLYTCIVNNSLGSAEANTTVVVGKDPINVVFFVNLTNEHFHTDLHNRQSSRFKRLSSTIKDEVLRLYSNTTKTKIEDVIIQEFEEGSVMATFMVTANVRSGAKLEDAKNEILSTMITETKDGKLGEIPVDQIIVKGAPLPPDVQIVSKQPTYAVLSWVRPPFYKQYEIVSYSIGHRKHAEGKDKYKTAETVKDENGTMKGVVRGLEPGQFYFLNVTSHRKTRGPPDDFMNGEKSKHKILEVATPDFTMKQVLLTIVLPVGLAIIIAIVILFCIRPYVRSKDQTDRIPLDNMLRPPQHYGPREENLYDIGRLLEEFPCRWKEIPRENVTVGKELGAGAFGTVVRADLKRDDKHIPCAVKMLKRFATEREHRDLFNELSIMSQVGNHTNIVSLIGACTLNGPLWVIVKIAEGGCLHEYLHKHRKLEYTDHAYMNVQPSTSTDDADAETLDKLQKLKFAHGIARGMKHLEKMKCVHRDLAARNVLLGKSLVPMVSDFGLSRDIYESGMYEDSKGGKRPVRWMAPESIEDYTCTPKSDVWSYGVTIWEIETAGTVPYAGVDSGMDILNEIKKGYRLEQPVDCDDEVYALMLDTWRANPLDRPSFMEIDKRVEDMLAGISEYLEIQNDEDGDDDTNAYDEVHISEQELANGHITQDGVPDHDDNANDRVRYTDIQGATASDIPINNPTVPHDEPLETHKDTSRDQDEDTSIQTKC